MTGGQPAGIDEAAFRRLAVYAERYPSELRQAAERVAAQRRDLALPERLRHTTEPANVFQPEPGHAERR